MADTRIQLKVHRWVVTEYLPTAFKQPFEEKLVELIWGGKFNFDAVSSDGKIAVNISTSSTRTATGKASTGAYHKIHSDVLYLLYAKGVDKYVLMFTEKDMQEHFMEEQTYGRFPPEVDLIYVDLPDNLKREVQYARRLASKEASPDK